MIGAGLEDIAEVDFWGRVLHSYNLKVLSHRGVASSASLQQIVSLLPGDVVRLVDGEHQGAVLLEAGDALLLLRLHEMGELCHLRLWAAAPSRERAEALLQGVRKLLPVPIPPEPSEIHVDFWLATASGVLSRRLRRPAPSWAESAVNYSAGTRQAIEALVELTRPASRGQLIVFHGAPGTGKTFAVRILGRAWRSWCSVNYLFNPHTIFGTDTLLADLLLQLDRGDEDDEENGLWHLVLMEDCDEFLGADAKARAGPGFSALLNLVDGILGEGLRVLVLVTTNEPLGRIHPALIRSGRCLAEVEFGPLTAGEAACWRKAHGLQAQIGGPVRLADLFTALRPGPIRAIYPSQTGFQPAGRREP
ncbi:MAG: AAA family ATPase [Candidatus Methylomirabilales bacterium]